MFTELNRLADNQAGYPTASALESALSVRLQQHLAKGGATQSDALTASASSIAAVFAAVQTEAQATAAQKGADVHQATLAALAKFELGDDSTPTRKALQAVITTKLASARQAIVQADASCSGSSTTPIPDPVQDAQTMLGQWERTQARPVYGAWKTMATAYQSCDVVAMDPLTSQTPDTQGIEQILQPSGNYYRHFIDIAEFVATNPYYKGYRAPASSCVKVESNPLVYDFGGKPSYASSTAPLNLFVDKGGTPGVLGIDCSGFVTSALMTAGLKLQSGSPVRPSYVDAVAARNYQDPVGGDVKLSCLKPISVSQNQTIVPGDILASSGHVVMIDRVGNDPFGIKGFTSASQCTSDNITAANFDFTVIQSSPVKNSIGIDRIDAASFFPATEAAMRSALVTYAIASCKAQFGSATTPVSSQATIVRHTGTPDCIDSAVVDLTSSSCISTCAAR